MSPSAIQNDGPNVIRPSQLPPQLTAVNARRGRNRIYIFSPLFSQSDSWLKDFRKVLINSRNRRKTRGGPNICPYCNKGWRTKSALEMHIRVHTGEEPFICPYCGKGHKQKGQLKVHITKHHPQVQSAFEALSLRRDSSGSSGEYIFETYKKFKCCF